MARDQDVEELGGPPDPDEEGGPHNEESRKQVQAWLLRRAHAAMTQPSGGKALTPLRTPRFRRGKCGGPGSGVPGPCPGPRKEKPTSARKPAAPKVTSSRKPAVPKETPGPKDKGKEDPAVESAKRAVASLSNGKSDAYTVAEKLNKLSGPQLNALKKDLGLAGKGGVGGGTKGEQARKIADRVSKEAKVNAPKAQAAELPQREPPEMTPEGAKLHKRWTEYLDDADLPVETKKAYGQALEDVARRLSPAAAKMAFQTAKKINFCKDESEVNAKWVEASGGKESVAQSDYRDVKAAAFYSYDRKEMTLDGGSGGGSTKSTHENTTPGLYAHELSHGLDQPDPVSGQRPSNSLEWQAAFDAELKDGQVSQYATTNRAESWAEFGRMVYGTDVDRSELAKRFPKCVAVWKEKGFFR